MQRILLLSDTASEHTQKWALGLAGKGVEVGLFSFNHSTDGWFKDVPNIRLLFQPDSKPDSTSLFTKISYLKYIGKLKESIRAFKPDVLHAHYATSYGLVGRLTGFHPFVISAWGTDVMRFPQQNVINKSILRSNFEKADAICATSETIRAYIHQVVDKEVHVIPFGVDVEVFRRNKNLHLFPEETVVIGSIKSLEEIYRQDILIKAFKLLTEEITTVELKLLIVGTGTKEQSLKNLCTEFGISEQVVFTGKVKHADIAPYFSEIDIFANLSEYESFGVSVIEAMACSTAVVVTDVGGLKEIVSSAESGTRVEVDNIKAVKDALKKYILDPQFRKKTGIVARDRVVENYNWQNNLDEMVSLYIRLIDKQIS